MRNIGIYLFLLTSFFVSACQVTRDISKTKDYRYLFVPGKKVYAKIPLYLYLYESYRGSYNVLTHDGAPVYGNSLYRYSRSVAKGEELHIQRVLKTVDIGGDLDSVVGYLVVDDRKVPFLVTTGYMIGRDPVRYFDGRAYFDVK